MTEDPGHRAAAPAPDGDHPVLVAIDLETTGLEPVVDEIIEVGAVKFQGREILGRFTSYVDPGRGIPSFIQQLTGITPADVEGAPSFASIAPDLEDFLGDHSIVGRYLYECTLDGCPIRLGHHGPGNARTDPGAARVQ